MDFSRFKVVDLAKGPNAITVSKSGVSFSQAAINSLGRPEFVKLLVNQEDKQVAVQVVDKDDSDATPFFKQGRKNLVVRWNYSGLTSLLEKLMNWDVKSESYKIEGQMVDENAMLFNLADAELVKRR